MPSCTRTSRGERAYMCSEKSFLNIKKALKKHMMLLLIIEKKSGGKPCPSLSLSVLISLDF